MSDFTTTREIAEPDEPANSLDLRAYAHVLLKRKWVILATMALVVTATVFWTLRQPKLYVATATILIDPKAPEVLGNDVQEVVQLGAGAMWWNSEYYNTQVEILTSRKLARDTVLQHDLHENPKVIGPRMLEKGSREDRIAAASGVLRSALSIQRSEENRKFGIRVTHPDAEVAAFLANAHVKTFEDYNKNLRAEGTEDASQYLSDELDAAEKNLRKSEMALFEFKKQNDILDVSLESKQNQIATSIDRYSTAFNDAKLERIELAALRKRVRQAAEVEVLESPIFDLTGSEAGKELKHQYYEELKRLNEISGTFGPKAGEFKQQQRKVDDLYAGLKREQHLAARAIDQKYAAVVETENQYKAELDRYRQEAFELEKKKPDYNPLARQEQHDAENFNKLLSRLSSSDLLGRLKTSNIRPLDEALVPGAPAFPRMDRNIALAVALSLFLGIGLAFLLEFLDRTIKSTEDVEQNVGAPVLGIIPLLPAEGRHVEQPARDLLVFREPTSRAAECCRQIRTNLLFMAADRQFETLVVSSPNPREGKSTTAMYLATTMAQSGQRVLVIDSDMRRPRLHKSLGLGRSTGLSNLIVGEATADDVIKTTDIPNLYFLPCGPTPPNPAELLMTDRFREVLGELEDRFDRVILDSPPILAVTDALVMAKQADGVVLVMKAGSTTRDDARNVARQLSDVDARVAGVVLNELDLDDKSYGYYYHYYGYSYGSGDGEKAGEAA